MIKIGKFSKIDNELVDFTKSEKGITNDFILEFEKKYGKMFVIYVKDDNNKEQYVIENGQKTPVSLKHDENRVWIEYKNENYYLI